MTPLSETRKYPGRRRRLQPETIALGLAALRSADFASFKSVVIASAEMGCLRNLLAVVRKADPITEPMRCSFLQNWIESGGRDFREGFNRELYLIAVLRLLMPRYRGPRMVLYRGESAYNRSKRNYGIGWSTNSDFAKKAALKLSRISKVDSLLIRTEASPEAIVAAIPSNDDHPGETEYLVDHRLLGKVEIIRRFEQV